MMEPRIVESTPFQMIGLRSSMSLVDNTTHVLWQKLMPRIGEIQHKVNTHRISLQLYPKSYFDNFDPQAEFVKWAGVAVTEVVDLPMGMEVLEVASGQYAIFDYKGPSNDPEPFQYIYTKWLVNAPYVLDHRPHFEVLGEKYSNNDPNSEEEIWIPIVGQ